LGNHDFFCSIVYLPQLQFAWSLFWINLLLCFQEFWRFEWYRKWQF
jgi:hypothetical protein